MLTITVSEENYIKAIFKLQRQDEKVTTNDLASELKTRPASVSDMIGKLRDKELVQYEKYYGFSLTAAGQRAALHIIRRHRLWEYFLVHTLGYDWEEVHELAEQMEHIQNEELIQRLSAFLGNPQTDPHGDPIPDSQGRLGKTGFKTLGDYLPPKQLEVTGVADQSNSLLKFLKQKGIRPGTRMEILGRNDFDGSMDVKTNLSAPFTLSEQVSKNIYVRPHGKS